MFLVCLSGQRQLPCSGYARWLSRKRRELCSVQKSLAHQRSPYPRVDLCGPVPELRSPAISFTGTCLKTPSRLTQHEICGGTSLCSTWIQQQVRQLPSDSCNIVLDDIAYTFVPCFSERVRGAHQEIAEPTEVREFQGTAPLAS